MFIHKLNTSILFICFCCLSYYQVPVGNKIQHSIYEIFFLKFPYINIILSTYKCFGRTSLILSFCLIILYFQNNTCQMLPQHFNISSTLMLTMVIIQIYVYVAYKFQFILQISSVVHLLLNLIFL